MDDGRITELFNLRDETAISEANTNTAPTAILSPLTYWAIKTTPRKP